MHAQHDTIGRERLGVQSLSASMVGLRRQSSAQRRLKWSRPTYICRSAPTCCRPKPLARQMKKEAMALNMPTRDAAIAPPLFSLTPTSKVAMKKRREMQLIATEMCISGGFNSTSTAKRAASKAQPIAIRHFDRLCDSMKNDP